MTMKRDERIRQLAHEIWEREGHPHGRDAEHWRIATEAYEAEMASSRLDDAGQPVKVGLHDPQDPTMRTPATAPRVRRGRKSQEETSPLEAEIAPPSKRKRRTKAEMAAAAAGVAAAAAVAATVAVTKRRRGAKTETAGEAAPAPAADSALRHPRNARSGTTLFEAEPAPVGVASDAAIGAVLDPSADGPADVATGPVPDPYAEPPSDAALESFPESGPDTDSSGERVAD